MIEPFIAAALIAGIGVTAAAAPLGCFVVWQRMAYFGEALAHSALLGVALNLLWQIPPPVAALLTGILFCGALLALRQQTVLSYDGLLGIISHSALAIGLLAFSFADTSNINIHHILFGDILAVSRAELITLTIGSSAVLFVLKRHWHALVLLSVNPELAQAEGIPIVKMRALLIFSLAVLVAVSFQIIGILLITSLLIIPAATARLWAHSAEAMAVIAAACGMTAVIAGVTWSAHADVPTTPAIVSICALLFALSAVRHGVAIKKRQKQAQRQKNTDL